jgi:hypothetical protein
MLLEQRRCCLSCRHRRVCTHCRTRHSFRYFPHLNLTEAFPAAADDFKVAVDMWKNGQVDMFASSGPWTYTATDSCAAGSAIGPRPLTKLSGEPESLGAEMGESDFTGYTPVLYADSNPPSLGTSGGAAASCMLTFDIKVAGTSVRDAAQSFAAGLPVSTARCVPCAALRLSLVRECLRPVPASRHADWRGVNQQVFHSDPGLH